MNCWTKFEIKSQWEGWWTLLHFWSIVPLILFFKTESVSGLLPKSALVCHLPRIVTFVRFIGIGRRNSRRRDEIVIYHVCIEGFLIWHVNWGRKSRFLRMLHTVQNRISAAQSDFKKSLLPDRWSYQGMQVTVGNMEKYSITLVISSWSDFSNISTRIAFPDCILQSSQIWCQCQKICFEVFSTDSRMVTCCGVSITWWAVYHVSMIDPSTRWYWTATRTRSDRFPSIAWLLGIFSLTTLESLPMMEPLIKSLNRVAHLELTFFYNSVLRLP
jgi:hypothetical protein